MSYPQIMVHSIYADCVIVQLRKQPLLLSESTFSSNVIHHGCVNSCVLSLGQCTGMGLIKTQNACSQILNSPE